jgi:hypothetical protein
MHFTCIIEQLQREDAHGRLYPPQGVLLVFAHVLHRHPFTLVAAARAGDASPAVVVHHQLIRAAPWDRVEGRGKGTKQYSVEC